MNENYWETEVKNFGSWKLGIISDVITEGEDTGEIYKKRIAYHIQKGNSVFFVTLPSMDKDDANRYEANLGKKGFDCERSNIEEFKKFFEDCKNGLYRDDPVFAFMVNTYVI